MTEYTCDICKDRGVVIKGDTAVPCSCLKKREYLNRFTKSRLPEAMQDNTFDNFSFLYYSSSKHDPITNLTFYELAQKAYRAAHDFVKNFDPARTPSSPGEGLLFTGPVGSGKTYLACCIANELLKKGEKVLFVVVPDLLDMIKATYNVSREEKNYTEQELLDDAREAPLLILDDLGVHNYTEWTKNKIYTIINHRLNHKLPTIITTNISLEDLGEYLGERTTSRIIQMCKPYRMLVDIDIRALKRKYGYKK